MLSLWQSDARVINPRYQYNTSVITHALNTCSATGTYGIAVYHNGGVDSFVKSDAWLCAINKKTAFAMLPYGLTEATILTDYVYRPRLEILFINYFYRPRLAILFSDDSHHSNQDLLLK
jgi:hypothetical protein